MAALAAIAAAIIPMWTPAQEIRGQENTPPVIDASPQFHHAATYQSKQRWELNKVIEVYEGPQANSELGKAILGSYDQNGNPILGQPDRISGITDALQIPWTSTTEGARTWTLGNRDGTMDSPKVKCKDQSGTTTHTWDEAGSEDSALFGIDQPEGDQQQGHIPLRFASTPDYEAAQDDGTDNEYLIRLVNDHEIHELGTTDATLGCDGSALDLKIRVKDVGPPAPPIGLTLTPEANIQDQFGIYWDHSDANQLIENGKRVDFPDPSFDITLFVISHEPEGLQFGGKPLANPLRLPQHFSGIEHVKGIPGVTYTITAELRNSEGRSGAVSAPITPLGPPAVPEAPTLRPESDTSIRAVWKEPDNNGGSDITGYKVQYQKDGADTWKTWSHTGTGTSATITGLDETSEYNVQIKAQNNLGTSGWSLTGPGSTVDLVVQITSGGKAVSGNNAVFTVTLSKAATVTVNLTHAWTGGYGESASGTLEFTGEISKNHTLPTTLRGNQGTDNGSVTVTIDTNAAYAIGTGGSATVNITQDSNSQPTLAPPSNQDSGAVYKFPAGRTDGIRYDSEPGTDPDGETLSYIITFTTPGTDSEGTVIIPAEGTAADLPGTLLTIKRSGYNFIFEPDGNVTPDQFEETYGTVTSHSEEKTLDIQLWASDGRERSPPVDFTLRLHYDPSGYFPDPAVNRSISRWELPDTIETYEGTNPLSGATVEWTSPLAGARNWATGHPATPVFCRHGPGDKDDQAWPDAGNEDSSLFTVGMPATTGDSGLMTIAFVATPDFENPSDSDKDNTYKLRLHNIHDLHEVTGDASGFPACSGSAIDVTVIVTNVNEPPVFPSKTDDRSVAENTAAGQNIGAPFLATDPDASDTTLTYKLGGNDAASFGIVATTGQLQTKADLDHETKDSYEVTVTATDPEGASDMTTVNITVTNVDEPPVLEGNSLRGCLKSLVSCPRWNRTMGNSVERCRAPSPLMGEGWDGGGAPPLNPRPQGERMPSPGRSDTLTQEGKDLFKHTLIDYPENSTGPVATYTAVDPEGGQITWSLSGDDSGQFSITSGALTFRSTPDYETPADIDTNNVYLVEVGASDSANTASLDVTITVTDENETPSVSGQTSVSYEENRTDTVATYTASDPEGTSVTWSLSGDDAQDFVINEGVLTFGATPNFGDAADTNTDNVYLTTVEASDGSVKGTLDVTVTVTGVSEAPEFPATETGTRAIAENTEAGQSIGDPVEAEDPDADETLTYTLDGTDATAFSIIESTGQLQTKADLDHEAEASYEVTVSVQDSKDASGNTDTATDATITITITVTNVNEPPEFPSTETGARSVAENTPAGRDIGLPVSATDPEVDTLTYSLDGTNAASFRIIESTGQLQTNAALDFETKDTYTVTVLVHDGKDSSGNVDTTTDGTVDVTITVTGENEPPKVTGHSGVDHAENSAADVATYTASDPEGTSITWSLSGDDAEDFTNERVLTFKTAPDFEAPADTDHDNEYLVTVRASDGDNVVTLTVTVTVTDENEPPAFNEETDARTIAEGVEAGVDIGTPVSATDPDASETLTYSLAETDAASFGIIARSGQLQIKAALDFEIKSTYTVTVTATDREGLSDTTAVTITVKDIGPPVTVTNLEGTFRENDNSIIDLSWTAPAGFDQNGQVIPFPHASHN